MKRVGVFWQIVLLAIVATAFAGARGGFTLDVEDWLDARARRLGLVPIHTDAVESLLNDDVVIVDARPATDYAAGHLPGAISLPWPTDALPPISQDARILVYCASAYCEVGHRLGARLRKQGYDRVALYIDGYDAWWAKGGRVAQR